MSGLANIVVLGRFWPRSSLQGALTAQIVTPAVSLSFMIFAPDSRLNNAVVFLAPGLLGHVVVSLLTPPTTRSFAEVAASLDRERAHIEGESENKPSPSPTPATSTIQ